MSPAEPVEGEVDGDDPNGDDEEPGPEDPDDVLPGPEPGNESPDAVAPAPVALDAEVVEVDEAVPDDVVPEVAVSEVESVSGPAVEDDASGLEGVDGEGLPKSGCSSGGYQRLSDAIHQPGPCFVSLPCGCCSVISLPRSLPCAAQEPVR